MSWRRDTEKLIDIFVPDDVAKEFIFVGTFGKTAARLRAPKPLQAHVAE